MGSSVGNGCSVWEEHLFQVCGLLKITERKYLVRLPEVLCCAVLCRVQAVLSFVVGKENCANQLCVCEERELSVLSQTK